MLSKLIIQNFAIIDQLEIEFHQDLSIITGETGAGKSIILGALGLLLGNRADVKSLKKTDQKCVIEGHFKLSDLDLKDFFDEHSLDYDVDGILRREINTEGKSRAFINDTPVNLSTLKTLGEKLVDIHSQHETITLNNKHFQLSVVDSVCNHKNLLKEFLKGFKTFQEQKNTLQHLITTSEKSKAEFDYLQFQFDELNSASLKESEEKELEIEQQQLTHAEEIKIALNNITQILAESDQAVSSQLKNSVNLLGNIEKYNPRITELKTRLSTSLIEIKDIVSEWEEEAMQTSLDPNRLSIIEERLNLIYKLQQKHRLKSSVELLELKNQIEQKISAYAGIDDQIAQLKSAIEKNEVALNKIAKELSNNRKNGIQSLSKKINELLIDVGMPNAIFEVSHEIESSLSESGFDKITFLFSANKGFSPSELSKVASGGELSRLMLCIKSIIAQNEKLATIIFDEIDTGISGEVANKVGSILQSLTKNMQVISITHLPQIAGLGDAHYFVYKDLKKDKTYTNIRILSMEERVVEIAKMLSGDNPSEIAMETAKELIKSKKH
jgi:DNA repair protein RecN (Recombination protein N)